MFSYVLRQILSGEATEIAVEAIHEYLRTIGNDLREGKIPFEDFIINKVRLPSSLLPPILYTLTPLAPLM